MRLTSVMCGSVSLSVAPRGRSRTCRGRVCFGGFLCCFFFFFPKRVVHGRKHISMGKTSPWAKHLHGQSVLCVLAGAGFQGRTRVGILQPVIWGEGPPKKAGVGVRGWRGQMPRGRRSPRWWWQHEAKLWVPAAGAPLLANTQKAESCLK